MFRSLLRPVPSRRLSLPLPLRVRQPYSTQRLGPVQLVYPRRQHWIRRTVVNCAVYGVAAFVWVQVVLSPLAGIDLEEEDDIEDVSDATSKSKGDDGEHSDVTWIPLSPIPLIRRWDVCSHDAPEFQAVKNLTKEKRSQIAESLYLATIKFVRSESKVNDVTGLPRRLKSKGPMGFGVHDSKGCVQPGLEIRNGEIKLVNRTIPGDEATRLLRIWNPFLLFRAFYTAENFLLRIERAEELRGAGNHTGGESIEAASKSWSPSSSDPNNNEQSEVATASETIRTGVNGSKSSGRPSHAHDGSSPENVHHDLSQHNPGIRRKFSRLFLLALEEERKAVYAPPPGSIVVNGEASVTGSMGTVPVAARAIYDPDTDRFCEVQFIAPSFAKSYYDVPLKPKR